MKILTIKQVRAAEEDAVNNGIFSFYELMQKATLGAYNYLTENIIKDISVVCVVCGNGNNGGDGLVLAKRLKDKGHHVSLVFPNGFPISNPANEFSEYANQIEITENIPKKCNYLIDALFGIGLNRPLSAENAKIINDMNDCDAFKIALDVPSGVGGDGNFLSCPFYADLTLTFIALKPCFVLPLTSDYCGKVEVIDIGVSINDYSYQTIEKPKSIRKSKNSHKGTFGTALSLTGSYGMCGASILSAKAALVSGVGIIKNFVCDKNYSAFTSSIPEAVTIPCKTSVCGAPIIDDNIMKNAINNSSAFLMGCGLGRSADAQRLIFTALKLTSIPTVIDADGINALSSDIELLKKINVPKIITPHPKEMARLCQTTAKEVEKDRAEIAKRVAINTGAVVVLKGANTVVASPKGEVVFNTTGNYGLATGGSGDVLAGMITARLCIGESAFEAAKNAVYLHGLCADRLAKRYNKEGITPTDIISELKTI